MKRALSLTLLVSGLAACVTDTTFQRAEALREREPDPLEVQRSLGDPSWKLRLLAAKACGQHAALSCGAPLARLARADSVAEVRGAALWALGKRCGRAERAAIVALLEEEEAPQRELFGALLGCPTADGWLLLATRDALAGGREAVGRRASVATERPEELEARRAWLEEVAALGAPNERCSDALDEVASQLRLQAQAEARRRRDEAAARERARREEEAAALATAQALAAIEAELRKSSFAGAIAQLTKAREAGVQGLDEVARRIGEEAYRAVPAPRSLAAIEAYLTLVGPLAVPEALAARDEAAAALWPEFSAWLKLPQNAAIVRRLRALGNAEERLIASAAAFFAEKEKNDEQVIEPMVSGEPLYPEVTGSFQFVKALDRAEGESLFSAADGLFVLRLSPGDSFRAGYGTSVHMTMHNRGERMRMTTGDVLPVFHSGSSPRHVRRTRGFQPDRSKEARLSAAMKRDLAALAKLVAATRRPDGERPGTPLPRGRSDDDSVLVGLLEPAPPFVAVEVEWHAKSGLIRRILIVDAHEDVVKYCLPFVDACGDAERPVAEGWL